MTSRDSDFVSPWRDGFLFVGNNLALDFVNTCPVQDGEAMELLSDFNALLRWFVAAEQITSAQASTLKKRWGSTQRAQEYVREARAIRERLRSGLHKWIDSGAVPSATVAELNRLLAEHPMRLRLSAGRDAISTDLYVEAAQPEDLLAPVADSAAKLFAAGDRVRVRQCGGCVLLFLDTSKKGTRHWCSMQLCGNRAKVAAYAERRRENAR